MLPKPYNIGASSYGNGIRLSWSIVPSFENGFSIERKLKRPQHFKASIGEKVRVKDFNKDILEGELKFADDNEIKIETEHGEEIISYGEISFASTYYEW